MPKSELRVLARISMLSIRMVFVCVGKGKGRSTNVSRQVDLWSDQSRLVHYVTGMQTVHVRATEVGQSDGGTIEEYHFGFMVECIFISYLWGK